MKKNTAIVTLEAALVSEKTIIQITTGDTANMFLTARRIVAHKRKELSHYIALDLQTNLLSWRNNKGTKWEHQFDNGKQASEWWQRMILSRTKQVA